MFVKIATKYAREICNGKIPACKLTKQSCERYLKDLKRKRGFDYRLDADKANRVCKFLQTLPHTKGRWASRHELLVLSPWQVFATVNLFGWVHKKTGFRRFREAYIEVCRKNGKSLWAAGIGLYMFLADGEYGAEVYSGATSEKQAWEIFRPARQICQRNTALRNHFDIEVNAKNLIVLSDGNRFEPIIGNPGDGASPSCALIDEFHEHKNADQVETMITGMGSREQPLLFQITTAGSDMGGPCYERRLDVVSILRGSVKDETVFGLIYSIDDDDEWDSLKALRKANPNLDVSVSKDFLMSEMAKARRSATKQNSFKTKHLNQWVGAKMAWMNMLAFQRCRRPRLTMDQFKGQRIWLGIDLASRVDLASVAILIPQGERVHAFYKHYLPEDAVYQDVRNDRYKAWAETGWLTTTPGDVIDFDYIEDDIKALASDFEIVEVGYDPFQATQFSTHMMEEGFDMVEVRPTVLNFSEPMKELEALVLQKQFLHNGDPVFTWMMGNVVAKLDKKDNIYPNKERVENKIDGVVATIMAMNRWMARKENDMPADYELTVV